MKDHKVLRNSVSIMAATMFSLSANALDKPQTMEDMWKIIQAQQQQLNDMKSRLEKAESKSTVASVQPANQPVSDNKPSLENKDSTNLAANSQGTQPQTTNNQVKKLERKTDILSQEVEKLRTNLAIPEEKQLKSAYGLGPAASKVYQVGKGLSIGGYGEGFYQNIVGDKGDAKSNADMERMVLYVGYKFTDSIIFNSELEVEHGSTGEGAEEKGEFSAEFVSLDFLFNPKVNVRTGLLLMPMGMINRMHEPLFYFGNHRPVVEQRIIPSTWREMGVGLFGAITPNLTYTTYVVNGLNASGFSSIGVKEGKGGGSQALAQDLGYVARLDYTPDALPGLTIGGSGYVSNSGQDLSYIGQKADVLTQIYESHLQLKYYGLEFRALGSWGLINNADLLSAQNIFAGNGQGVVGSQNYGWYTEAGYDVLPLMFKDTPQYLAPFVRYEKLNTIAKAPLGYSADPTRDQEVFQVGLQYKPISQVVLKADYRNFMAKQGSMPDDFNLGFGFIF